MMSVDLKRFNDDVAAITSGLEEHDRRQAALDAAERAKPRPGFRLS